MTPKRVVRCALIVSVVSLSLFASSRSQADVRLPGFFGDHMVLQQQKPILVWGWTDPGDVVTVEIGGNKNTATADGNGEWKVELPALTASDQPHKLTVKGSHNTIELTDVLIGEVWLCSGQSNMEWYVERSANAKEEIANANHPLIRHIKVAHRKSTSPIDNIESEWETCSPETVAKFTATGYYMARHLQKELGVPIGLINSSWGGTRVEPWTPPSGFKQVPALDEIYQKVQVKTPGTDSNKEKLSQHIASTESWLAEAKQALQNSTELKPSPAFPDDLKPFTSHQEPCMLYNGMIDALVGFPIRGAIWYQGESNAKEGMMYFEKKKALIQGWRGLWGQGDFPFYFVQIAPFQYGNMDPSVLAQFWEAQAATTSLPNTKMVVINDIATLNDIHPPNKQDVGLRLANLALKYDYEKSELVADNPEFESLRVGEGKLTLKFKLTGGGLKTRNGNPPSHFEIIGKNSKGFQPATAAIEGDNVVLTSEKVASPTAFRFAWHKTAEPNLTGATGLPVGAVRGGEVPTFLKTLPIESEYQLVYQIDLANLKKEIEYETNNSKSTGEFDRIGYLVELNSSEFGDQKVFVTMDAFTDDVSKIGIPTAKSNAHFQEPVQSLEIFSNTEGIKAGTFESGNIEFWSRNYGPGNVAGVAGASAGTFDFGDQPGDPNDGYGCMQIHNTNAKQTIFAINHWSEGGSADLGIGSQKVAHPDWTFSSNADKYSQKKLRVYVRPKK